MLRNLQHHWPVRSRREFFQNAGSGLAGLALGAMMEQDARAAKDPLAPKPPHFAPKAKSVIWLLDRKSTRLNSSHT